MWYGTYDQLLLDLACSRRRPPSTISPDTAGRSEDRGASAVDRWCAETERGTAPAVLALARIVDRRQFRAECRLVAAGCSLARWPVDASGPPLDASARPLEGRTRLKPTAFRSLLGQVLAASSVFVPRLSTPTGMCLVLLGCLALR